MSTPAQKVINLYCISDSSGATVLSVADAICAQFSAIKTNKIFFGMVRSIGDVDKIIKTIAEKPGIVLYTLVDQNIRNHLKAACNQINVHYISAIAHVVKDFEKFLNYPSDRHVPGWQHTELDSEYFKKINAIEFTIRHDDGQKTGDHEEADIILIGVSRTSKTPTSLYLAQRGYRVMNIPFIKDIKSPLDITKIKKPRIIGLYINPEKLQSIRVNRLSHLGKKEADVGEYSEIDAIKTELQQCRTFFYKHNIDFINVTNKAIEETAAEIINIVNLQASKY